MNENTIANIEPNLASKKVSKFTQIMTLLPIKFKSKPIVSVLYLNGVIGRISSIKSGMTIESYNKLIEKAFSFSKLSCVCLCINSPGGSPVQSELIANRIIALSKEKKVPVYTFIEDVAASGGYWLACAGSKIYASKNSIVGSIGVVSSGFGFHEAISKVGIERRVYTQGSNKSILDPFKPTKSDDIKIINNIQKQCHEHFINYVKERRIGKLTQNDDILFNGEFWAGLSALDLGLIDGIQDMYSFIKQEFDDDVNIEYITNKQPWIKKKLGIASQNIAQGLIDGVCETIEYKSIQERFNIR